MNRVQTAAVTVFGLRIAYGAALIVAPERMAKAWLGPVGDPAKVALRGIGGREIILHGFAIAGAVRGKPLRGWLMMSMAGDVNDIAATFAGSKGIPDDAPKKTAVVAGGSAALSAAVLIADVVA
jgi:hypothetical protein